MHFPSLTTCIISTTTLQAILICAQQSNSSFDSIVFEEGLPACSTGRPALQSKQLCWRALRQHMPAAVLSSPPRQHPACATTWDSASCCRHTKALQAWQQGRSSLCTQHKLLNNDITLLSIAQHKLLDNNTSSCQTRRCTEPIMSVRKALDAHCLCKGNNAADKLQRTPLAASHSIDLKFSRVLLYRTLMLACKAGCTVE